MTPREPSDRWRIVQALVGAGLAALAAVSYAPAFGRTAVDALADRRLALPVVGTVAVMTMVCLLLASGTRLAPVSRVATALTVLAGYVLLVVSPGWGLAGGPKRLLTTALPVEATGPELATVVILIGLATLGAVEPALRRRAALLPLLAPLAATGLGAAVSASAGPPAGWLAPAFALGAAILLLVARQARQPAEPAVGPAVGPVRRVLAGGVGLAVLAGVAAASWYGPELLPGRPEPLDPRQLVPQPVEPRETTSPLVLFPALRRGDEELSLTVHASHPLERLRYVSLDIFDGSHWLTRAEYRRAGRQLPLGPPELGATEREERVEVVRAGPLGWLVSSGRPVEVSAPDLGVNEDTGDVVLPADRPVPAEYTVHSVLSDPDTDLLEVATPVTAPLDDVLVRSEVARELGAQAREIAGAAPAGGYQRLHALEEHLRGTEFGDACEPNRACFEVDPRPDAPGGHGLRQISILLEEKVGTAEQYASAFAVLARTLGYQSRVVIGFIPQPVDEEAGVYEVTGQSVHAWAEVRFDYLGWVRFDPTPAAESVAEGESEQDPSESFPDNPSEPEGGESPAPPDAAGGPGGDTSGVDPRRLGWYGGVVLAVVLGVWALGAAAVPLAKTARRRRRRTARDPDLRVLGAWRDTLDRLREAGLAVAPADTSGEVVSATGQRFGGDVTEPLHRLSHLHDAAAYAPGQLADSTAEAAWRQADQARRAVTGTLRPLRRLRAAISPRPLLGR